MFQSDANGFGGGGMALSGASAGGSAVAIPFGTSKLIGLELGSLPHWRLHTDLGDKIGSRRWWTSASVLLALCAGALYAGSHAPTLPVKLHPAFTPAQFDEARPDAIGSLARGAATGSAVPGGATTPSRFVEALAEIPERPRIETTAHIGGSDSFEAALRHAGVGPEDAAEAAKVIGGAANLRGIRTGTAVDLVLGRRQTRTVPRPLKSLGFRASLDQRLELARADDGSMALKRIAIDVDDTPLRITGVVGNSFADAASTAGLSETIVDEAVQTLGYAVDFQHQVSRRDHYDIVVEHRRAADGLTETGGLLYTALVPADGQRVDMLRWNYGGKSQFFRGSGESAKKGLMRTPVNGAHLTSSFGMRFHPILNYSRLHQGVDFGAAWGSPVLAAAGGKVTFAGAHGGHGNYIQVLHHPGLMTAYAHLSRFAVKPGASVAQGQVIGYVGSTGLSTGPHLHYEVWLNGAPVNPVAVKFLGGTQLGGGELERFKARLDAMRGLHAAGIVVAEADTPKHRRA